MDLMFAFLLAVAVGLQIYRIGKDRGTNHVARATRPGTGPGFLSDTERSVVGLMEAAHDLDEPATVYVEESSQFDGEPVFVLVATGWHAETCREVTQKAYSGPRVVESEPEPENERSGDVQEVTENSS